MYTIVLITAKKNVTISKTDDFAESKTVFDALYEVWGDYLRVHLS